jgi:Lipid desaturase domain
MASNVTMNPLGSSTQHQVIGEARHELNYAKSRFSTLSTAEKIKCFARYASVLLANVAREKIKHPAVATTTFAINTFVTADFFLAINHWIGDNYFEEDTPIIGKFYIKENRDHHRMPGKCLDPTYWEAVQVPLAASVAMALALSTVFPRSYYSSLAAVAGWSSVPLVLHRFAHTTDAHVPWPVRAMHGVVLQTREEHARHHATIKECYATLAPDFWNPILDGIGFWDKLEFMIERITGFPSKAVEIYNLPRSKL